MPARRIGRGERIGRIGRHQLAVDEHAQPGDAEIGELAAGAFGLVDRRALGAGHQDEAGPGGIAQGRNRLRVKGAFLAQGRERPEAGGAARVVAQEAIPSCRQGEQAQRVPRGRGVEDHVVVGVSLAAADQQPDELVESGDLGRAGAGQLLLHSSDDVGGKRSSEGADGPFEDCARRGLGIDVEGRQVGNAGNGASADR